MPRSVRTPSRRHPSATGREDDIIQIRASAGTKGDEQFLALLEAPGELGGDVRAAHAQGAIGRLTRGALRALFVADHPPAVGATGA